MSAAMRDLFISPAISSGADFSECGRYRYKLWRYWGERDPLVFVMLNPSIADASNNDPTISRCMRRARFMGFGALEVVNLFAYRSPFPDRLLCVLDPIGGPRNDEAIAKTCAGAGMVICAWGNHPVIGDRGRDVIGIIRDNQKQPHALKMTRDGHPAHPLYLPYSSQPFPLPKD